MESLIRIFVDILPALIISATAIYIFHEATRFLRERFQLELQKEQFRAKADAQNAPAGKSENMAKFQLQAAERFVLYLERIAPDRLVMRLHQNGMTSRMLQNEILKAIREEYDHNLSQQIYLSDGAWELIKNAREEMVKFITATGDSMRDNATGIDLSRKIFEMASRVEKLPNDIAIRYLRKEMQLLLKEAR